MFGSPILDVTVGLIFVYLLLSLIATAVREGLEGWLRSRAGHLELGIRTLLQDLDGSKLAKAVYEHPLIFGLYAGHYKPPAKGGNHIRRRSDLPSYIPSRSFALALIDIVARGPSTDPASAAAETREKISLDSLKQSALNLQNEPIRRALLSAIDMSQASLDRVQTNLEEWFDSSMDRVSGWYKRETQWILFTLGIAVAVAANVNSLALARHLYDDKVSRDALVVQAGNAETVLSKDTKQLRIELERLNLPIGWKGHVIALPHGPAQRWLGYPWWPNLFEPLLGWAMTALAISLGAPFWFDLLNKFMVIRSTVKPKEKSPDEGSEDRRPSQAKSGMVDVAAAASAAATAVTLARVTTEGSAPARDAALGHKS
jgi:hypothetical protein